MRRRDAAELVSDDDAAVVLFGSWGRGELTSQSDDDWAVIVAGDERRDVHPSVEEVKKILGRGDRRPGSQGIFGCHVFTDHLVGRIGLSSDDNPNLTRRMLLILESVAVTNPGVHNLSRQRALDGYLDDSLKDYRPPRFLLNDLVRYWRTICVDFVGKERASPDGEKWALRNAKLRTARKMLFASGLLPTLGCHRCRADEMPAFLSEQFASPASDRVAWAFLAYGALDAGVRTFAAYDRWIGILSEDESREELKSLPRAETEESPLFREVTALAEELEQGLLTLLFDTELFLQVRDFGIF